MTAATELAGTKIFVSSGEHDLSENIVHLVLARLPRRPMGKQGHLLVHRPEAHARRNGGVGVRNSIECGALEHKLGSAATRPA